MTGDVGEPILFIIIETTGASKLPKFPAIVPIIDLLIPNHCSALNQQAGKSLESD